MKYSVKMATHSYGKWKVPEDFRAGEEVLIAFSRKNGHAYLIAGKYEVHGHFIFKKTFSRDFCELSCEPLLYIRFKNITREDLILIENYIESHEGVRESSCINYCLITLFNSLGIRINSQKKNIVNLEDCLLNILHSGASRNEREQEVEVYKTLPWSILQIVNHFNLLEKRFSLTHICSRFLGKILFYLRPEHRAYYREVNYIDTSYLVRRLGER